MYLRKLWKAKSRHRELNFVPLLVSHPTTQFSGGSLHNPLENPKPAPRQYLEQTRRLTPCGVVCARFRSLDRRVDHCKRPVMVGHEVRGEMGR